MAKTVFGVFSERQNADAAVKDLIAAGVPKGQIHFERITREDHGSIELTEDERQRFVDAVGEKAALLRVKVADEESSKVRAIMMRQGGATFLRTAMDDSSEPSEDGLDFELLEPGSVAHHEFEEHFQTEYAPLGERFEDLLPAYEFGYHLGAEQGYENMWKDWNQVDRDAKTRWEADHPGTWERFQLAIEEGWATAPARLTGASLY